MGEIAAVYERSQTQLRNFGVDADFNIGAMKQVWEGMAATLFLSTIRHRIDVIKEAAGRFGEAAKVLNDLDGATTAAKQQIADGEQAMKDEAARNPFAAYNRDQYQRQGGWNPYGGIGGPSYGQTTIASGQSALARAYEEAAAKLTSLAMTAPTQERAAEKYFEKEMKKKGAPAEITVKDGEIKGFVPKWDRSPPWYRPDKQWKNVDASVEALNFLPGGREELAKMHKRFGGGVRGFVDPTFMFQDAWLYSAEGHPIRASVQFVNGALTIVGIGTLVKAAGKAAMKAGSRIGIRAGALQAAKETPALIPKPKPIPRPVAGPATRAATAGSAEVPAGKFDYLFGRVTSGAHNTPRSRQNVFQMKRLGVPDTPAGHAMLRAHFDDVVKDGSNILRQYSDKWGQFQVRESVFIGPSGAAAKFETTWQVTSNGGLRLTTVIPKGGGNFARGGP